MLTQGLVAITCNGQTVLKVVCGCDGGKAEALAALIQQRNLSTVGEIYDAALAVKFGCPVCLMVFNQIEAKSAGGEIPGQYWESFDQPTCNPRWDIGKSNYCIVIDRRLK